MKDKMKNNERLKTLEDIKLYNSYKNNSILRYEGIKWIKEILKNENCKADDILQLTDYQKGQYEWIKYFFNIEEKDLK